jgi:hypothetical protein
MLIQRICSGVIGSVAPATNRRDDDQALAEVGRQRPGDELHQIVVNAASFLDRRLDGGKVVVGEHHVGRVLGDLGAGQPHGDADVGLLERRRVVDAITGHCHDLAVGLQCPHQAQLLRRFDARKDVHRPHHAAQPLVVELRQLATGEGRLLRPWQSRLAGRSTAP